MSTHKRAHVIQLRPEDAQTPRPGFARLGVRSDDALTTVNWFQPGYKSVGTHSHDFDQLSYILTGQFRFFFGEDHLDVTAPAVVHIPGGLPHGGEPLGDEVVLNLDVFAPVRDDYLDFTVNRDDFE